MPAFCICMLFLIVKPNSIQIGPPRHSYEWSHVEFSQITTSATVSQLYFRFQIWRCHSQNKIEIYLHICTPYSISIRGGYLGFLKRNGHHIPIILHSVSIMTFLIAINISVCIGLLTFVQSSSKSLHPCRWICDIHRFFSMAAMALQVYFRFRAWQRHSFTKVEYEFYLQTTFRRDISVYGWYNY